MKTLCKYLGGSISYGLNTPESDRDERYVFLHTDRSKIIGLERHDHESKLSNTEDTFGYEIKHFLNLLKKGNTMCLEMLYNNTWLECTDEFKYIQSFRNKLIDSHALYKCLKGYCHSERNLVLGARTGVLGGKRKLHLETYGYSYKNAVQFLRLCWAGRVFFQDGYFPVNIRTIDINNVLFNIKTNPGSYSKDDIIKLMDEFELSLDNSYDTIRVIYKYDTVIANNICYELYMPLLSNIDYTDQCK